MSLLGPDLSGKLKRALDKALADAQAAEAGGDGATAAKRYDDAHNLINQLLGYPRFAPTRQDEFEWRDRANRFRMRAEGIRRGQVTLEPAKPRAAPPSDATPARREGKKAGKEKGGDAAEMRRVVDGLMQTAKVGWDDIGGLADVKQEIKFALGIWLAKPPVGASGEPVQIQSWRNMLFYGPPGTGKTLLAAATSRTLKTREERGAVFFNVKVSSVLSKYFGESTKIISELYGSARDLSPAVVFLDEFESLAASRDEAGDTGAERRILSTILAELDGLAEKGRTDIYVLTVAATNRPWDLDAAVLSRFDKKILIPLPDATTRRSILEILIDKKGLRSTVPHEELVAMTDGFSGREMERFCKEAQNRMVQEMNLGIPALVDKGLEHIREHSLKVRPLSREDFGAAASRIKPQTTREEMERYLRWKEEHE